MKIFIIILLSISFTGFASSYLEVINQMPYKDKEDLKELFNHLIRRDSFAHTLFGIKPVTVFALSTRPVRLPLSFKNIRCKPYRFSICPLSLKWQVWKKWAPHLNINEYLLLEAQRDPCIRYITLINKSLFIVMVDSHLKFFQDYLDRQVTGKDLIKEIEEKHTLNAIIKNNSFLLGILLGYGKHNAMLYNRREHLMKLRNLYGYLVIGNSSMFDEIDKQIDYLTLKLKHFSSAYKHLSAIGAVQCVADNRDLETKFLKKIYSNWQSKISTIYNQGDMLEITLDKLTR